ncbi:MAG: IS4 family transposase [Planctomycetia bacterium]|nr:IS4 family transposase [Planctomycetia bacterium]
MGILQRVATALKQLFGPLAQQAAQATGVIVRQRKFTPMSLAQTFVLGFLQKPNASDEELAFVAAQAGAVDTPQAIDQRQTPKLAAFLEELFRRAVRVVIQAERVLAPILERFAAVTILDSTVIGLPDSQSQRFAGCGGRCGFGRAAMKLQTELDLRSGAITHVEVESGRSADSSTPRQHVRRAKGSLRITDLGYFCVGVFAAMVGAAEHFLSRLQFGTGIRLPDGQSVDVLEWLACQSTPCVDRPILLGLEQRLACRLIAWRLPEEQANRRRQRLREEFQRKWGREPSAQRLAWCEWTILVTSVPVEMLSVREAAVLYRARWQIELLFKRWKSQGRVATLDGSSEVRQVIRVWARLLAVLVQHWLLVSTVWGDATKSVDKLCQAVRLFVSRLLGSLDRPAELVRQLGELSALVAKTCRRNRRAKPGTFELLNAPSHLDYCLT